MALRFIAIDPTTDDDGSPTIWEDENRVQCAWSRGSSYVLKSPSSLNSSAGAIGPIPKRCSTRGSSTSMPFLKGCCPSTGI